MQTPHDRLNESRFSRFSNVPHIASDHEIRTLQKKTERATESKHAIIERAVFPTKPHVRLVHCQVLSGEVLMPGAAEAHQRFVDANEAIASGTASNNEITVFVFTKPGIKTSHRFHDFRANQYRGRNDPLDMSECVREREGSRFKLFVTFVR